MAIPGARGRLMRLMLLLLLLVVVVRQFLGALETDRRLSRRTRRASHVEHQRGDRCDRMCPGATDPGPVRRVGVVSCV